jgi:hypothetical protein
MPLVSLSHEQIQSDLRRIDELSASIGRLNTDETALLTEHLHSMRAYLLGAMPEEYAASLQLAKDASRMVNEKARRDALMDAFSYLQSEVAHPATPGDDHLRRQAHAKGHAPPPPGTTSALWNFFGTSDTSFGIFYPKQHIVAIFRTFEVAQAALAGLLTAGFNEEEMQAAPGSEMLKFFTELRRQAGLWADLMASLSRSLGTEEVFLENYIRLGREGAGFLAVYSPLEIESERICELLESFRPIAMQRYLSSGIQSLI